jgi:hypothetical protein
MWIRTTNGIEFIPVKQTIQGIWTLKNTSSSTKQLFKKE